MVELGEKAEEAAWKIKNLEDYDRRLEDAVRRVDDLSREHETAALVIYESVLTRSGRSLEEIRETVREFARTWEDEEEPLTIPRVSGLMNVEGDRWFFGDGELRAMTGRLLGQFQHRVAQYNYIDEREVLKRWADSYDTRLFVRRRIFETEPVAGVVPGMNLRLMQYLRVAAGGNTFVPSREAAGALETLGYEDLTDEYAVLGGVEDLALRLELPVPVAGDILEGLARDGVSRFPEPPAAEPVEDRSEPAETDESSGEARKPSPKDRAARRAAREEPKKGEEPTRVQDPQASNAPGVEEEEGAARKPTPPQRGREDKPGDSETRGGDERR